MRIRGRGAPPPPPDLPPSPPPQVQDSGDQSVQSLARNQSTPPSADDRGTSDLPVQTGGLISSEGEGDGAQKETAKDQEIGVGEEGGSEEMGSASPSDGRGSNGSPGPETSAAMEHWREEDRAVPLKKRRATFVMEAASGEIKAEKAKKRIMRVRSKRPKKWIEEDEAEETGPRKNNGKKGRSGGAGMILEGSRCSRVNGRGWRCHQQTLVGYSLCEHHLGKGRLKSMNSVRSSPQTAPVLRKPTKPETSIAGEEESDGYEGEKPNGGGVKARSMRSLLGQTMAAPVPVTLQLSSNGNRDI